MPFRAQLTGTAGRAGTVTWLPALAGTDVFSLATVPTCLPSLILVTSVAPGGVCICHPDLSPSLSTLSISSHHANTFTTFLPLLSNFLQKNFFFSPPLVDCNSLKFSLDKCLYFCHAGP